MANHLLTDHILERVDYATESRALRVFDEQADGDNRAAARECAANLDACRDRVISRGFDQDQGRAQCSTCGRPWWVIRPHLHVVHYETSHSGGLRGLASRLGLGISCKKVKSLNAIASYLRTWPKKVHFEELGRSNEPGRPCCDRDIQMERSSAAFRELYRDCGSGGPLGTEQPAASQRQLGFLKRNRGDNDEEMEDAGLSHYTRQILEVCEEHQPDSLQDLKDHCADDIFSLTLKSKFEREVRKVWDRYCTRLLRKTWKELIPRPIDLDLFYDVPTTIDWFTRICNHNSFDIPTFVQDVFDIMTQRITKKNALFFFGPAQSGKTVMGLWIARSKRPFANLQRFDSKNNFPLQDGYKKNCILINEPKVDGNYIETFKNVLEGMETTIDVKYERECYLKRTSLVITSNLEMYAYIQVNRLDQIQPLRDRTTRYNFHRFEELEHCKKSLNPVAWEALTQQYIDSSLQ